MTVVGLGDVPCIGLDVSQKTSRLSLAGPAGGGGGADLYANYSLVNLWPIRRQFGKQKRPYTLIESAREGSLRFSFHLDYINF